jgi:uncharacterized protein (TIGR02284 family)
MMTNDDVISTLNDLIVTSKDGEEGFRTCSEDFSDAHLKAEFAARARSCAQAVSELQDLVRALGGKPSTGSSVTGALHRRWIDIKSAILGRDDEAILNECERGEDHAVESYRDALAKDLPPEIHAVVNRQYLGVLQNHDMVKALRDRLQAHS